MTMTAFSILAGGKGARIGGRKAHIPLLGAPLITHVAKRLGRPLSVVGDTEAAELIGATALSDRDFGIIKGPLLGICTALEWGLKIKADLVVIAPCDCPLLPDDIVSTLHRAIGSKDCACVETSNGLEPLISIWRSNQATKLAGSLGDGKHPPLHQVLSDFGGATVRLGDDNHALNVNTKDDLERAEHILSKAN